MRFLSVAAPIAAVLVAAGAGALAAPHDAAARAASLRAVADSFAQDGDLARAQKVLADLQAKPEELLAALREPVKPAAEMIGGTRKLEITDGEGKKTELFVVAPPAEKLKAATKPLGLVCLLHGLGGGASGTIPFAERFVASGEYVCVAPTAQKLADERQTEDDGIPLFLKKRFKNWWDYDDPQSFPLQAIAKARELYWIDTDRIVLSGASMGGYGTWNIGLRRPDRFSALVAIAGGISRFGCESDKDAYSLALLENGRNTAVYSAHGDKDPIVPFDSDKEACDHLEKLGGKVIFKPINGGHDPKLLHELAEGPLLGEMATWLAEQRREKSPLKVTYVSIGEPFDGAWWLRIVERKEGAKRPKLAGSIDRDANRVNVRPRGVRTTRVYLDERILDASRSVEIAVNGSVAWSGKIEPSVAAILESWRSRRDPGLVYPAFVDVQPVFH